MTTLNAQRPTTGRPALLVLVSLALLFVSMFSGGLLFQQLTREPAKPAPAVAVQAPPPAKPQAKPKSKPQPERDGVTLPAVVVIGVLATAAIAAIRGRS